MIISGQRNLRLGDAELVDSFADDLDRAIDVLAADSLDLVGRRSLVDQFEAALEVEAELGRHSRDDHSRERNQADDEGEHEEMSTSFRHLAAQPSGVRTISRPPSSS